MTDEAAKRWAETWKKAGPKLQQIRDEELRQRSNKGVRVAGGVTVYEPNPHRNGMVTMQAWFMRKHMLDTLRHNDPEPPSDITR